MGTNTYSSIIAFDASTVPPVFRDSEMPENVSLVLSQSTSLMCDVTGSPTPVITWYKDGTPVGEILLAKLLTYILDKNVDISDVVREIK